MAEEFTPYTTAVPFHGQKPSWVPDELDQQRLLTYEAMERIYWNDTDVFTVSLRGSNEKPIMIPTARVIVDTTNRYVAPSFSLAVSNRSGEGPDSQDTIAARMALNDLMVRERFRSKFGGNKRYGLIRGDWIWHVTADPAKAVGTRITLTALDPSLYFPVPDPNNVDKIIAVHLAEQVTTPEGARVRRQTYRKNVTATGTTITVQDGLFEVEGWMSLDAKPVLQLRAEEPLPPTITAIPVYHIRNFEEPGNPFGSSELRGVERLPGAINQVISDEDLALVLDGIGVYWTDAPDPIDPTTRQKVPWRLGPGRVAHIPQGNTMGRLNGVGSVTPFGDHLQRLRQAVFESTGTPEIAIGKLESATVASGVALRLELGPMLAKVSEKNNLIVDTHDQMFYDLVNGWFPGYEDTTFTDVQVTSVPGEPLPVDREKTLSELHQLWEDGVIDTEYYRSEVSKLGYSFPDGMAERAAAEFAARNQDAFAARAATELEGDE